MDNSVLVNQLAERQAELDQAEEEIFSIMSIYGEDISFMDAGGRSFTVVISKDHGASLSISLPSAYPLSAPPVWTLVTPTIRGETRHVIDTKLGEFLRTTFFQQCVLYELIEKARECLLEVPVPARESTEIVHKPKESDQLVDVDEGSPPEIVSGEAFAERRSTFQAHVARVHSVKEVQAVLRHLKRNRKIAEATHNVCNIVIADDLPINQSINRSIQRTKMQ